MRMQADQAARMEEFMQMVTARTSTAAPTSPAQEIVYDLLPHFPLKNTQDFKNFNAMLSGEVEQVEVNAIKQQLVSK